MYGFPFMMSSQQEPRRSMLTEIDDNIKAMELLKKHFSEGKKEPPKKGGDVVTTAMFFTFATPFVMLIYGWAMTKMLLEVLEALGKIKGLH